jgi:hypothetical protein
MQELISIEGHRFDALIGPNQARLTDGYALSVRPVFDEEHDEMGSCFGQAR